MEPYIEEYYEPPHRLFQPSRERRYYAIPLSELIAYNSDKSFNQLCEKDLKSKVEVHHRTLVVHIDGACRNNGKAGAKAAYGVYFGPGSKYNSSGLLGSSVEQTSTRAELEALIKALDVVSSICSADFKITEVKVATDSSWLVDTFTKWIEDWIENDGVKSNGKSVKYFHTLKEMHERLEEMEYGDDGGIEVQFWRINRENNKDADALANLALDDIEDR
jgi:ribonuclease HI